MTYLISDILLKRYEAALNDGDLLRGVDRQFADSRCSGQSESGGDARPVDFLKDRLA